ncbi:MAG: cation:proton antiporter, partial [Cyanobacteria bacterium REEB444]|nr:cation:proton antiporter [Cyanobacteria bacterium REEB444]
MFLIPETIHPFIQPPFLSVLPLMAMAEAEKAPIILTGVLLTLVVIYLASKLGAEVSKRLDFPPVLGELVSGVLVGMSALHLVVFPENGMESSDSFIMSTLQWINGLT